VRKPFSIVALLVLLVSALAGQASGGPTTGGLATDNIEHVKHIPMAQNGVGGRLIGKYFYMNDQNKVMIYDVSDPVNPEMLGFVAMPQEWQFSREDIDGNGDILVVPNTASGQNDGNLQTESPANAVYIIDVEDKANPKIISKVPGAAQHTFSCVLNCTWAYGSGGNIIDLRNPAKPKLVKSTWGEGTPAGNGGHDVEEVAPGLVMTATEPMMLLDARKDPAHPKVIAVAERSNEYMHQARWPRGMKDKFLLAASETTMNGKCSENSGSFQTWDARAWRKGIFKQIDKFVPTNGIIVDGKPVAQRNCTAHWIEEHPDFNNGGYVASGFYDHGTRFFEVTPTGQIKEAGYFMAYAGQASAAYWITDEIVYTVDYNRGLDILRFSPPKG
jgi:hypothetical protein